ncbi:uncharacterized protein F5Z01DRAFT_33103 [Emericellopsis atlantica]|uniref:Uncharacterized protein n=1 Tax=Emericellopsis atlantica TaxID=2614577 RepID=A0A9P7ZW07_9HYPO|nr:uncharacterized protein F5Z01DRAFT_33103 [Emericellopsis atlantica]KAG9259255.1 hypothetical protein F5Z01DRAFT_33103 [Emericellopsis atlantica]
MAQGHPPLLNGTGHHRPAEASGNELSTIQQLEKILQFRDTVVSGHHPTIKLPPGVAPLAQSSPSSKLQDESLNRERSANNQQSYSANAAAVVAPPTASPSGLASRRVYGLGSTEINPILLQKSDELIRAEFQAQRARLERAIKEEAEQQRRAKQEKPEPYNDLNLSEVLAKALTLVQAQAPENSLLDDEGLTANEEVASDSFDNETFYSSRHDTPESNLTSRVRRDSEDKQQSVAHGQKRSQHTDTAPSHPVPEPQRPTQPSSIPSLPQTQPLHTGNGDVSSHGSGAPYQVPGLNNYAQQNTNAGSAPGQAGVGWSNATVGSQAAVQKPASNANDALMDPDDSDSYTPSPLLSSLDPAPTVAQPASAPSYPVEEPAPPASGLGNKTHSFAAPAQVSALRNEPIAINSPDSSPQSGRSTDRKKGKKKKRKADRQAPEDVTPHIKPEPRSQSPISAPNVILRPNKRQKQAQRMAEGSDRDGIAVPIAHQPQYAHPSHWGEPVSAVYGSAHGYAYSPVVTERRHSGGYGGVPQPRFETQQYPHYAQDVPAGVACPPRAVSHVAVDDSYRTPVRYYNDQTETSRMSVRPDTIQYAGQPMHLPSRIVVDEHGREYLEPPRLAARQSVAPPSTQGAGVVYEQDPRAVSRHPPPFDERTIAYSRAPSAYPPPRRVVTQPEYVSYNTPAEGRPREYSVRPAGGPAEYVQLMPPPGRHPGPEPPREYVARAASARPPEPTHYELPREYGRMQSVRPEGATSGLEYGAMGQPQARREVPQPYMVEYAQPQAEQPVYQRSYSVRPPEGYYEQPQPQPPAGTYIERPQGAPASVMYAQDDRPGLYR